MERDPGRSNDDRRKCEKDLKVPLTMCFVRPGDLVLYYGLLRDYVGIMIDYDILDERVKVMLSTNDVLVVCIDHLKVLSMLEDDDA